MTYQFADSNSPVFVSEGQTVRFKFKAPSAWDTTLSVTIQIGQQTTVWFIHTIPEDFAPDPFPFSDLNDALLDTVYTYGDGSRQGENVVTVSGLTPSTEGVLALLSTHVGNAGAINYALRIKEISEGSNTWSDWHVPVAGESVKNTDQVQVRLRSSIAIGQETSLDLAIGSRTERWTIETAVPPPNIPVPFPDFDDLDDLPVSTLVYSNILQIQGLPNTAIIQTSDNALIGVSSSNSYVTDGLYDILDNGTGTPITFDTSASQPTIQNGQFLQLAITTSAQPGVQLSNTLYIGDIVNGMDSSSLWNVTTGDLPSENPDTFIFPAKTDVIEDTQIESDVRPVAGITGLGNTQFPSPPFYVNAELLNTDGSNPLIRVERNGTWSSWGVFPTPITNTDKIQISNKSSAIFSPDIGSTVSTQIKVGDRQISPWTITTNAGPDTEATFAPPGDVTNVAPCSPVVSSIIPITGINRPISITATNGALISVDFGTPTELTPQNPVTFDPAINQSIQIYITSPCTGGTAVDHDYDPNTPDVAIGLGQSISTVVTIGSGLNNSFTWNVTNYAQLPPKAELAGCWYSKKGAWVDESGATPVIMESKEDGYAIGTVLSVLKSPGHATETNAMDQYGDLKGSDSAAMGRRDARYPGYIDCDGSDYNVADFPDLWTVIGNNYDKPNDAIATPGVNTGYVNGAWIGRFRVPDYRNVRMVGPGGVDGNKASSVAVQTRPSTGPGQTTLDSNTVGGYGGYWYVDSVDVTAGDPYPFQQIEGDAVDANFGTTSAFFNLGTVRTLFNQTITEEVDFVISGNVTALVGPILDKRVNVPQHSHYFVTAQTDGNSGDPLIKWGAKGLPGYGPASAAIFNAMARWDGVNQSVISGASAQFWDYSGRRSPLHEPGFFSPFNSPNSTDDEAHLDGGAGLDAAYTGWQGQWDGTGLGAAWKTEWDSVEGADWEASVKALIGSAHGHNDTKVMETVSSRTWWPSPGDSVKTNYFVDLGTPWTHVYSSSANIAAGYGTSSNQAGISTTTAASSGYYTGAGTLAVIDTEQKFVRVNPYAPPIITGSSEDTGIDNNSMPETHSHLLSNMILTDLKTDYTYGNDSGSGLKHGLGSASSTQQVLFGQISSNQGGVTSYGVGMELNSGTFSLVTTQHKPIPNVRFEPNRTVELVPQFHKVKYIIKAF